MRSFETVAVPRGVVKQPIARGMPAGGKLAPMVQQNRQAPAQQAAPQRPHALPPMAAASRAAPNDHSNMGGNLPPLAKGRHAAAVMQRAPWAQDDAADMFDRQPRNGRQPLNSLARAPQPPQQQPKFGGAGSPQRGSVRPGARGGASGFGAQNTKNETQNQSVAVVDPTTRRNELAAETQQAEERRKRLQMEAQMAEKAISEGLKPCRNCNRSFLPDRLPKHEAACAKASKPRKVFNVKSQRQTSEAVNAEKSATRTKPKPKAGRVGAQTSAHQQPQQRGAPQQPQQQAGQAGGRPNAMPKWKAQSLQFRAAMRAARGVGAGPSAGKPGARPPAAIEVPDYRTGCPHCKRKFAQDVAERHIPKCATTRNRPNAPKSRR